jgi:hypothetical protein
MCGITVPKEMPWKLLGTEQVPEPWPAHYFALTTALPNADESIYDFTDELCDFFLQMWWC